MRSCGGRRSARSIASAIGTPPLAGVSPRGPQSVGGPRRSESEQKADELVELEQELLDEVAEIDDKWEDKAADIETVSIRAEATDVRVADPASCGYRGDRQQMIPATCSRVRGIP